MKRLIRFILLTVVAGMLAPGWGGLVRAAEETIKIAIIGPITGPVAQYGDMQMNGARMGVEQINARGGVGGKRLEAILLDDVCEPKQAVAVANKVVNDGIKFVVGHLCSGSTQPAARIYNDEGILMITPASTNPEITRQGYPLVFRTIGTDDQQGPVAGNFIADQIKPKQLAIIHDKQQYGQGIAEEVKKTVEGRGVNVVLFEGINKGQTDFSALITKMKRAGVDFVYYGGYHPELGLILRQSREQGFEARFMGPEGVGNKDISAIAGPASEGLLVTLPADFSREPANAELVKAFQDKDWDPSGPFVMPSYAAVQVIADTINKIGSTDPRKVAEEIHKSTYQTPIGAIAFKENGDLKEFQFVVFTWHADATKTPVK
jgi:branched-chain amino acid transport system substrate-binding protein